ncbi:hypothetical protein BX666DRAFT_1907351 [Dichotomocladium elegans]|nr:hypothetical protein BX666DRAFT_2010384 [Dichotomocladium elegans]KAI9320384.1 hypothetical protein BX666DRAFT_1907351 [Dichotomocladium elegans]
MITGYTETSATVVSFTDSTISYTIAIENNKMTACTCPDFRRSHALCKHMYLLNRVKRIGLLDLRRSQAEIVVNQQVDQEQLLQAAISR